MDKRIISGIPGFGGCSGHMYTHLHGLCGHQRLVVYGTRSLHSQAVGQMAIGAGETLVVVVRDVVLPSKADVCGRGSGMWGQAWGSENTFYNGGSTLYLRLHGILLDRSTVITVFYCNVF